MRVKVVVIGMFDSIHFARWLEQFSDEEIDVYLFPSSPHRRIRPELLSLLKTPSVASFYLFRWHRLSLFVWLFDLVLSGALRGYILSLFLRSKSPDIAHAIEIQGAGYALLTALRLPRTPKSRVVVTNYGSDLFWFGRFPKHRRRISELLSLTDLYAAECNRDLELARDFGYAGSFHTVHPNAGGFQKDALNSPLIGRSERNLIAVKGYHGWAGKAVLGLRAIAKDKELYQGHKIVVFSANARTVLSAIGLRIFSKMDISFHRKGSLSHKEMLELFSSAIIYVGISETDGISTSMLEAMSQGAIPVQSGTSCCDEWFVDSGAIIARNDLESIRSAMRLGMRLAEDDRNREINKKTIIERASYDSVRAENIKMYRLPETARHRNGEK